MNIDTQHPAWQWYYFLKTGEVTNQALDYIKEAKVRTDFANLESEYQKMIMRIDKEKTVNDAILSTKYREGRDHERRTLALESLKIGVSFEQVSKATGLDIETLKKLKNEDEEGH